jgi:hypothetical protein
MNKWADIGGSIVVVAAIFVLVRPRSQGPTFVKAVGSSFANVLGAATGGSKW